MAISISSSQSEFSTDDVYSWLLEPGTEASIAGKGLAEQAKVFMKAKGYNRGHEKAAIVVKKALAAYTFITVGNALRNDPELTNSPLKGRLLNSFAKSKISQIFDAQVRPDRELLFPSPAQIEFFSEKWDEVVAQYPERASSDAMSVIQEIVDAQGGFNFPIALSLFKLGRDPKLQLIRPDRCQQYIERNYPFLVNAFNRPIGEVFEKILQRGDKDFLACVQECVENKEVVRGVLLIKVAHQTAVTHPHQVEHDIRVVAENYATVQNVFAGFAPQDLEMILKNLQVNEPDDAIKPLLLMGMRLDGVSNLNLDPSTRSLMTPLQAEIWDKRRIIPSKAASVLHSFVDRMVQKEVHVEHVNMQELLQPYIQNRDALDVTDQFKEDGHRYEQLVLSDPVKGSVLFPGNNTRLASKPLLLDRLREFATIEEHFDPVLFATLQESICQGLEKPGTEDRIRHELSRVFNLDGLHGFILMAWRKECSGLAKIDDSHFMAKHEYKFVSTNQFTGVSTSHIIRLDYPIRPGDAAGDWVVGQPKWTCLPELQLAQIGNPIPLAALAVPVEPMAMAAPNKPGVEEQSEESEDDDSLYIPIASR